ncbi:MAG: hypothetical protein K2W96_11865 [Gemmataceae bacterium]|nr:hypothetical protein [Gemmataceae bacterium]
MTMNDQPGKNEFERVCKTLPPVEVDCSGWESDIPDEAWSTGEFVSPTVALPAVEADCSHWLDEPATWLELVIAFNDHTSPADALESTNQLIGAVHAEAPRLGLAYDFRHSRREGEDLILALRPTGAGTEQELRDLAARVRLPHAAPFKRTAARVGHGAA